MIKYEKRFIIVLERYEVKEKEYKMLDKCFWEYVDILRKQLQLVLNRNESEIKKLDSETICIYADIASEDKKIIRKMEVIVSGKLDIRFQCDLERNIFVCREIEDVVNSLNGQYRFAKVYLDKDDGNTVKGEYDAMLAGKSNKEFFEEQCHLVCGLITRVFIEIAVELHNKSSGVNAMQQLTDALGQCGEKDIMIYPFKKGKVRTGANHCRDTPIIANKYDRIICSDDISYSMDSMSNGGVNSNVLVFGGSGSGKTRCVLEPNLQGMNHSNAIVTLTKPRLIYKYKSIFEQRGYKVDVIDFSAPGNSTVRWDPVYYLRSFKDIGDLAAAIVYADVRHKTSNNVDPYWDSSSCSLLSALICAELHVRLRPSMANVIEMFRRLEIKKASDLIETNLDGLFEVIKHANQKENSSVGYCFSNWRTFKSCPPKTGASVLTSLSSVLCNSFTEEILGLFRSDLPILEFDKFNSADKYILFIKNSPMSESESMLSSIFYSQAMGELFSMAILNDSGRLARQTILMCDDAALSPIQNLQQYSSILREAGISTFLLYQDVSQLAALYGDGADVIMNNSNTIVYLGGKDVKSAQKISSLVNLPLSDLIWMPLEKEYVIRSGEPGAILCPKHRMCLDKFELEEKTNMAMYGKNALADS